jgi:hypothetical protein
MDSTAAGLRIATLATNQEEWKRVSLATRHLAATVFDMVKYVKEIDKLGSQSQLRGYR